ncbi:hypothetical protein IMY05_004G0052900 [Salix suchowensis]|nr:hypothetical protein IMY05_004G0052900 [Salix suchowensis]
MSAEDVAKSTSDDDTIHEFHNELNAASTTRSSYLLYDSGRRDGIQSLDSLMNPANGLPQQNPANDHSQKNPAYGHPQQYPAYGHPQQNPANGLLGKRLLRAPVCVAGSSAQNVRSCNLLSKSSAPYRPPHLYKMNLHSEGENRDEIDGKTFCFAECPGLESAEVERRGRDSQRARRNKFKPHLKNEPYNHPPLSYIPLYVLPMDPYDASTRFGVPTMQPMSQQILVPAEFPHQVNGLPRGPSYAPINGMASYSQVNQMQTSPLNSYRTYRGPGSPTTSPGSDVVANSDQAAINNRLPEMEHIANQMHPGWPWTGNVQQCSR